MIEASAEEAIEGFSLILDMESTKGEWGFKALKQIVKLFFQLKKYSKCLEKYNLYLSYVKSAVTKNVSEKSISSLLEFLSSSQDLVFLENIYSATINLLEEFKNERLWFRVHLKLAKLYFDKAEYPKLRKLLRVLQESCTNADGSDDAKKGTQLIEIYALEILMYTVTKNNRKLEEYYLKSLSIKSAIPHPKIMAVIRECGGKMYMRQGNWDKAQTDFFEAFKNYEEAGSTARIQCLKYLVLANMMSKSTINPFESQETKPYKNDPEIMVMNNLVQSYQINDILQFEKILKENHETIMQDEFIRDYVQDLLTNIRTSVLLELLKPYNILDLSFIAEKLNIPSREVEDLLAYLIMDGIVKGKIDQISGKLELQLTNPREDFYKALEKLTISCDTLLDTLINQVA